MGNIDEIRMDVPLFIRLLEFAKEEAKDDITLHKITENIIFLSTQSGLLTMSDYPNIIGNIDINSIKIFQKLAGL